MQRPSSAQILLIGEHLKAVGLIAEHVQRLGCQPLILQPTELITSLTIRDAISAQGHAEIHWLVDSYSIHSTEVAAALNLFHLPSKAVKDACLLEDADFILSEFNAYFYFAISMFRNCVNKPGFGSITGSCESLLYQWSLVDRLRNDIGVPVHHFGISCEGRFTKSELLNLVINSDIYNLYCWSRTQGEFTVSTPHLWYVIPPGDPVLSISVDDDLLHYDVRRRRRCNWMGKAEEEIIRLLSNLVMAHFGLRMTQILTFHNDRVCFGFASPHISYLMYEESFAELIYAAIARGLTCAR